MSFSTSPEEIRLTTSALVIGTGAAGLRAAIELTEQGVQVLTVGKRRKSDAHTVLAAGGINAALGTLDPQDSWQQHAADTLEESYWLADPRIVETLAQEAPRGIQDLENYGMPFAREEDGRISQRFFGAHTWRRTAFIGDYTGLAIQRTLVRKAQELNIPVRDDIYITRLLVNDNRIFGAYGFDVQTGVRVVIFAETVLLAAGGHTRIWRRTSSRRDENTGDSMRLAAEAGARLRDVELVQFHPSGILEPEDAAGTLITEAVRGEGGILRNSLGERFMTKYDPERLELSTRDRVALANYTEILEGRGTENGGVWLDVSHLPREQILERLPRMYRQQIDLQMLDITQEPIEVAPTAHYSMGGIWVDWQSHGTDVTGLYALGEAATGVHGANRLGGNSLIECIVFGRIAAEHAASYIKDREVSDRPKEVVDQAREEITHLLSNKGHDTPRRLQRAVRNIMTEHAGVVRDEIGLQQGIKKLAEVNDGLAEMSVNPDYAGFDDLIHAFDLKSAIVASQATLDSALERKETRGAHNRSDYPELDPQLQVNITWKIDRSVAREEIPQASSEVLELVGNRDTKTVKGKLQE